MNDQTAALLQNLANKLGTTSEYLWGILLRQATLSGTTDLIQYAILGVLTYFFYKWCSSDKRDWDSDSWPPALLIGIPLGLILITVFFCFPNTIYAFFNPEYWALDRVLSAVKK